MGKFKQLGRTVMSFLPKIGLMRRPDRFRPLGISAMMTVKNEEDWIEKSIRSVVEIVDEVVVVDNGSTDDTCGVVRRLGEELGPKLRLFSFNKEDFCAAVNYTLVQTRFRWILRWHGDFVARTTGSLSISRLRERFLDLDPTRYFCVWIGPVSLDGDLYHQIPEPEVELEPLLYEYSPSLHYRQIGRFEVLQVPWFYKRIEWRELYFFHMRYVKPSRTILYRYFWTEWMSLPDKSHFPTLDSYVRHSIVETFGTSDIAEAARRRIVQLGKELVPYDEERYGDYPAIIEQDLRRPRYRLIFRNGEVVNRSDLLQASETMAARDVDDP